MASLRNIYFGIVVVLACLTILSVSIFALSVRNGLTTVDKQNIQSLIGDLNSKQNKKDLFFAASSLSKIGKEVPTIQSKCVQSITTVDNPNDLYFTIAANVALKCAPLSTESYGLVQSALAKFIDGATENTISAETIYSIARILLLTKSKINTKDVKVSIVVLLCVSLGIECCMNRHFTIITINISLDTCFELFVLQKLHHGDDSRNDITFNERLRNFLTLSPSNFHLF